MLIDNNTMFAQAIHINDNENNIIKERGVTIAHS
jgi:cytosine/adenosine deaminase-related metal-dependent hydrolase